MLEASQQADDEKAEDDNLGHEISDIECEQIGN